MHDAFDARPNFTRAMLDVLVDELRSVRRLNAAARDTHTDLRVAHAVSHTDLQNVLSLGVYRGELRRAIHHMKYRNARWL